MAERLAVAGYVQKPVVDALLAESSTSGLTLVDLIIERKQMTPEAMRDALSRIFGLPVADLRTVAIDWNLVTTFPAELARQHMLLPLHKEGDRLVIVVVDPTQSEVIRAVRRTIGLTIDMRLASLTELAPVVHKYFSPRLVAVLPSSETIDIVVPPGEIKIGRSDHNDVVLPDPTVGSTHAIIRAHGDEYTLVDFGSRNGVFVDGERINQSHQLKNGDVIGLGQCLLTFKLPLPDAAQSDDGATKILTPNQMPALRAAALAAMAKPASATPMGVAAIPASVPDADGEEDKKGEKKKKKKDKEKDKEKEEQKLKSAWIGFASRIIAQVVGAIATIILGLAVAGKLQFCNTAGNDQVQIKPPEGVQLVEPAAFGETNGKEPFNASGIVALGDGDFLFCDNNTNDALLRLRLGADGLKSGPLERLPLQGLAAGSIDDMEAMTLVEGGYGKKYVVATTSLYMKRSKKEAQYTDPPSGLLRVSVEPDGSLKADLIPGMRDFVLKSPDLGSASILEPDDGGLNVEGLAWDPANSRLLFGIRTPATSKKLMLLPVKVGDIAGAWDASNLTLERAILVDVADTGSEQGVRSIEYVPSMKGFLIVVGNSTSQSKAPFTVHFWDGSSTTTRRLEKLWFGPKVKPEGFAPGLVGGKEALVFVDDNGGSAVVWGDDERLK